MIVEQDGGNRYLPTVLARIEIKFWIKLNPFLLKFVDPLILFYLNRLDFHCGAQLSWCQSMLTLQILHSASNVLYYMLP